MNSGSEMPTAIVTGAGRGIGAATVRALAGAGFHVLATARSEAQVLPLVEELKSDGKACSAGVLDVDDASSIATFFGRLGEEFGPATALINNAGRIGPIGGFEDAAPEDWIGCVETNLFGAFRVLQAFARQLPGTGAGTVVNISSGAAMNYVEGWSAYCTSKAALAMLTRAAAAELEGRCRVYGFQPGVVDTEMQGTIRASGINRVSQIPRSDLLPPEEPARIITWLCTARPEDLSGTEFRISDEQVQARAGDFRT